MYLSHYNLEIEPFQVTPDPSFLYLSTGHKEALASIVYGVQKKKGFVLILGAVGVGKTTILRAYLEKAGKDHIKPIYIFNSNISYITLLKTILVGLGYKPTLSNSAELTSLLHESLIEEYKHDKTIVLIIDEAQNMPVDTLEKLRMLSNLETTKEKLIQIVFSAQPEFEKILNQEELKQLKQRIAVKVTIPPLTITEGVLYIRHRLRKAAKKEVSVFSKVALKKIIKIAHGVPRVINILCDNSLITAFGYGKKKVDIFVVKEIIQDFNNQKNNKTNKIKVTTSVVVGIIGLLVTIVLIVKTNDSQPQSKLIKNSTSIKKINDNTKEIISNNDKIVFTDLDIQKRVVKNGDTLAKLIYDVYGHVNLKLINMIKKANPDIKNENIILNGQKIVFPMHRTR